MINISIIIPVYNGEKYIRRCLNSITKNKELNKLIEIIIVNDNSTDNTKEIINNYIKNNSNLNIQLINNCSNKGCGYSRNVGIDNSNGKYIIVIDSDDTINPDVLLEMYNHLEKYDEDYCMCRHVNVNKGNYIYIKNSTYMKYFNIDDDIVNGNIINYPQLLRMATIWNILLKKDLLIENNLYFETNVVHDDTVLVYYLHHYGKKFGFINKVGYYYYDNEKGLTASTDLDENNNLNFNYLIPILKNKKLNDIYKFYIGYYSFYYFPCQYLPFNINIKYFKNVLEEYFKYINENKIMNKLKEDNILLYKFYKSIINNDIKTYNLLKNKIL